MRILARFAGFLLHWVIDLLLLWQWSIPAWIALVLHYWMQLSLWWFAAGLALWIFRILFGRWFIGWATRCGAQRDPPKENKNPYSNKSK